MLDVMSLDLQAYELRLGVNRVQLLLRQRRDQRLGRGTHLPVLAHNQRRRAPVF